MKITINKQFKSRAELDDFVRSRVGEDSKENIQHEIEMDDVEARTLALSASSKIYGVRVTIKNRNER